MLMVCFSDDGKTSKVIAAASDGEFWIVKTLSTLERVAKDSKHATFLAEVDTEETDSRAKARQTMASLKTASSSAQLPSARPLLRLLQVQGTNQSVARGAELLLAACLLRRYCEEEQAEDDSLEVRSASQL
jgi:DNA polymerase phi